jgi:hypothetical protein
MRRTRFLLLGLVYLLTLIGGAVALWKLLPAELWATLRDTYVTPRSE